MTREIFYTKNGESRTGKNLTMAYMWRHREHFREMHAVITLFTSFFNKFFYLCSKNVNLEYTFIIDEINQLLRSNY